MSDDRQYDEDEVSEIFARAASMEESREVSRAPAPVASGGLTLAQLQEIGAEVGIPPERIADAARGLSTTTTTASTPRTFLGAPSAVSLVVPIARAFTDDEWTRLVVDLRETFGAEGRIKEHGTLRSWRNGNLQVHVEPAGDHYRVRMQTLKGDVFSRTAFAGMSLVMSIFLLVSATGEGARIGALAALLALAGVGMVGYTRALLPRWAAERAAQMKGLADRIPLLLGR